MGRRWGKSVLGGCISLATAAAGGRVAWCVPAYRNGRPLWRFAETATAPLRAAGLVRVDRSERLIEFPHGGMLGMYSMDNEGSIRGEAFHLVVVDEAAMVSETAWEDAIQPTLSDYGGDAILISTPRGRNWFWREWVRGQDESQEQQRSWTAPTRDNPNPRIRRAAELARMRVSERTYRQEWLAQFLDDGGSVFRGVLDCAVVPGNIRPYPGTFVMAVDWGRERDFTALGIMDTVTKRVVDLGRFNQIGWSLQRGRLEAMYRKWQPVSILAEQNSIGSPNIEELQRAGLPVRGFVTTNETKAQIIESLALAIETRAISYPNDPVLVSELQAYEQDRLPSGRIRYSAPEGLHDDTVIMLALLNEAGGKLPAMPAHGTIPKQPAGNPFGIQAGNPYRR